VLRLHAAQQPKVEVRQLAPARVQEVACGVRVQQPRPGAAPGSTPRRCPPAPHCAPRPWHCRHWEPAPALRGPHISPTELQEVQATARPARAALRLRPPGAPDTTRGKLAPTIVRSLVADLLLAPLCFLRQLMPSASSRNAAGRPGAHGACRQGLPACLPKGPP